MRRVATLVLCLLLTACPEPIERSSSRTDRSERPALETRDPSIQRSRPLPRLLPKTTYFFAVKRKVTCGARGPADFRPIPITRRPGPASNLLRMALSFGLDHHFHRPLADPSRPMLRDVTIEKRVASIDYVAALAKEISPHCGASIWFNEVIRTAFQFPNVASVRILFGGRCEMAPFEGDPRSCTGFRRKVFEHPRAWGPIPRVSLPLRPDEVEVLFFDADCHFPFPNYRVHEVPIAKDEVAVLTAALNALLRFWYRSEPRLAARSGRWVDVSITEGVAILDWRSLRHLGWASTTCGGVVFGESVDRTALQFPTIDSVQHRHRGSCERFNRWAQGTGDCSKVRLDSYDQLEKVEP